LKLPCHDGFSNVALFAMNKIAVPPLPAATSVYWRQPSIAQALDYGDDVTRRSS